MDKIKVSKVKINDTEAVNYICGLLQDKFNFGRINSCNLIHLYFSEKNSTYIRVTCNTDTFSIYNVTESFLRKIRKTIKEGDKFYKNIE